MRRSVTLKLVRRLLEEDMGLEHKALDAYKQVVSKHVDQVGDAAMSLQPCSSCQGCDLAATR